MIDERSYSVEEAAALLHASRSTVLRWLRAGRLRGYRLGGTKLGWRIRESALRAFIAAREAQSQPPD